MGHLYHGYVKLPEGKHKSINLTMEPWIELIYSNSPLTSPADRPGPATWKMWTMTERPTIEDPMGSLEDGVRCVAFMAMVNH